MIKKNFFPGMLAVLAVISIFTVPAVATEATDSKTNSNSISLSVPSTVALKAKEKKALKLSEQWIDGDSQPFMAGGGKLVYVHGASQPTIIAAPMQVCDVELEPGEKINEIVVGDSARWLVESGTAGSTTHLFIKPVDTGLESSAVITTDRRTYHLKLVSQKTGFTPYVGFVYHAAIQRAAKAEAEASAKKKEWTSTQDSSGQTVDLAKLNFRYEVSGDRPKWRPERIYDDGRKTYIQLPTDTRSGEMPVLHILKGGESVLVNYRVQDTTMMVDGIFDQIALIAGVGSAQEAVEIRRER